MGTGLTEQLQTALVGIFKDLDADNKVERLSEKLYCRDIDGLWGDETDMGDGWGVAVCVGGGVEVAEGSDLGECAGEVGVGGYEGDKGEGAGHRPLAEQLQRRAAGRRPELDEEERYPA